MKPALGRREIWSGIKSAYACFKIILPDLSVVEYSLGIFEAKDNFCPIYTFFEKNDLKDFKIYRNGQLVPEIERGTILEPLVLSKSTWSAYDNMEEVLKTSVFKYPIDTFKPINGKFPSFEIEIHDLMDKRQNYNTNGQATNRIYKVRLEDQIISKIWSDFAPYTGDNNASKYYQQTIRAERIRTENKIENTRNILGVFIIGLSIYGIFSMVE